jgi:chaperonin GroES
MANARPLHDRVLIRRIEEAEQKVGGIIIPDTAKEKPLQAEVIAVGSGRVLDTGQKVALTLKPGDKVLIGKRGQEHRRGAPHPQGGRGPRGAVLKLGGATSHPPRPPARFAGVNPAARAARCSLPANP